MSGLGKVLINLWGGQEMNWGNMASSVSSMPKVQEFLKNIKYPAAKQTIVTEAQSKGADNSVVSMLQKLPEKQYQSPSDVTDELGKMSK
jgi:hypothetical protein